MRTAQFKMLVYVILAMLPVFISFLAEFLETWRGDGAFTLHVPWWVWLWVCLQAVYQAGLVVKAFLDSSFTDQQTK